MGILTGLTSKKWDKAKCIAVVFATLLPAIVAYGAIHFSVLTALLPIIAFIVLTILAAFRKLSNYPIYLFGLSLALIWSASMLGIYIIGSDAPREYYLSVLSMQNGWHPSADNFMIYGMSNSSAVIGVFVPWVAKTFNIELVWVYKAVLPVFIAIVPVILYHAFSKQVGKDKAFFAVLFFLAVPVATTGIVGIAKSMVAEFFFAMMILMMVGDRRWWIKLAVAMACLAGMVVSHYTVAILGVIYAIVMYGVPVLLALWRRAWRHAGIGAAVLLVIVVGVGVFGNYYYSNHGGNAVYIAGKNLISWIPYMGKGFEKEVAEAKEPYRRPAEEAPPIVLNEYRWDNSQVGIKNKGGAVDGNGGDTSEVSVVGDERGNGLDKDGLIAQDASFMGKWPRLVRSGLAVDFPYVSAWGRAFRVFHVMTLLALLVGLVALWRRMYGFKLEFMGGILASGGLLLMCLLVPWFANIISMARVYHLTLFFIAPLFVMGIAILARSWWRYATAGLIVVYFVFTSGLVYEITKSDVTEYLDTPYSFGLSGHRTGLVVTPTENDLEAAEWVANDTSQDTYIVSDYNGVTLLATYMLPVPRLKRYKLDSVWLVVRYPAEGSFYLFVNERSVQTGEVILPIGPGLRMKAPMPDYIDEGELVYDNGARVYYFSESP